MAEDMILSLFFGIFMNKMEPIGNIIINSVLSFNRVAERTTKSEAVEAALGFISYGHKALLALQQGKLRKFDALCGDQACQIRAIAIVELKLQEQASELEATIGVLNLAREALLQLQADESPLQDKKACEQFFATQVSKELKLSVKMTMAINAFILRKTRGNENRLETDPERLTVMPRKLREKTVFKLKERITQDGLVFLQGMTAAVEKAALPSFNPTVKAFLKGQALDSSQNIVKTPIFFNLYAILNRIKQLRIPMEIRAQNNQRRCLIGDETGHFQEHTLLKESIRIVIVGNSVLPDALAALTGEKMEELLLINAAHHPQYPDENKEIGFLTPLRKQFIQAVLDFKQQHPVSLADATQAVVNTDRGLKQLFGSSCKSEDVVALVDLKDRLSQAPGMDIFEIKHIFAEANDA